MGSPRRGAPRGIDRPAPSGARTCGASEHPGIFTTEDGSKVAQKALLFGDDIPAIATIGFGEFERRPEMGFDVAVAELSAPATVGGEGGDAEVDAQRDSATRLD
jgi:hypothetical protein